VSFPGLYHPTHSRLWPHLEVVFLRLTVFIYLSLSLLTTPVQYVTTPTNLIISGSASGILFERLSSPLSRFSESSECLSLSRPRPPPSLYLSTAPPNLVTR
jgi:hypothetical protein